ncbi:cytochrome c-type biogenesis protein CcmE [Alphaproteobacteria bacterium]|nr:cytochrome c-type biogenesis protein CcmE [Alphaproteobacteria bacterium]
MTRIKQRLFFLALGGATLALSGFLAFAALQESMVYYYTPSEIRDHPPGIERHLRVGGMVEAGSLVREGAFVRFVITDYKVGWPVIYRGVPPSLLRENDGVVIEGRMNAEGGFIADLVMARHDENYRPREVTDALRDKAQGGLGSKTE